MESENDYGNSGRRKYLLAVLELALGILRSSTAVKEILDWLKILLEVRGSTLRKHLQNNSYFSESTWTLCGSM